MWLGPIVGCAVPLVMLMIVPRRWIVWRNVARFFAGFCLIANGAYIGLGSFAQVGDCGEMLRTGTPLWVMIVFGMLTVPAGFFLWHRLGSLKNFFDRPALVTPAMAYGLAAALIVAVVRDRCPERVKRITSCGTRSATRNYRRTGGNGSRRDAPTRV